MDHAYLRIILVNTNAFYPFSFWPSILPENRSHKEHEMTASAPIVRHFLPPNQEKVLNNRLVLDSPKLLVTVVPSARSWMIDLDGLYVDDPKLVTFQMFAEFEEW